MQEVLTVPACGDSGLQKTSSAQSSSIVLITVTCSCLYLSRAICKAVSRSGAVMGSRSISVPSGLWMIVKLCIGIRGLASAPLSIATASRADLVNSHLADLRGDCSGKAQLQASVMMRNPTSPLTSHMDAARPPQSTSTTWSCQQK